MNPLLILAAGGALLGVPVLLHLIVRRQPKRLVFPALRFLQRKKLAHRQRMNLRQLLLLALRMLLIALFALALFQPSVKLRNSLAFGSGQPVAVVLVIDTSPSMGYKANGVSRLDEARRRALEFLDEVSAESKVAVLDPNDPAPGWELTVADARRRIEALKEPTGYCPPVTSALPAAYRLLASPDAESLDPSSPLPKVVAVFSDRTANCWDAARTDDLMKQRDAVPQTAPLVHLFFDVGADAPVNAAIVAADMALQLLAGSSEAVVTVTVRADGADVPSGEVTATLDDAATPVRQEISVAAGSQKAVTFRFKELKPGFHTAVFRIRDDNLTDDNARTLTFKVAEKRKILTVTDDPGTAVLWEIAHNFGRQEFDCSTVTPDKLPDLKEYEAVTLLGVDDPKPMAERLVEYVRAGGKLLVAPGATTSDKYHDLDEVMPALLSEVRTWAKDDAHPFGLRWRLDDDRDLNHPMLAPVREWKRKGNVDVLKNPRYVQRYWGVTVQDQAVVAVRYDDAAKEPDRSPAVIEKAIGKTGGRVLLLTTRVDDQPDRADRWNDYWETEGTTWNVVFPWLLVRYLCGSPDDAAFNFATGAEVSVPLPPGESGKPRKFTLEGPGVTARDAELEVGEKQAELKLAPPRTLAAGAYAVRSEDRKWEHRFALQIAAEESVLTKVPEEAITAVFGADSVIPLDRQVALRDKLSQAFPQPRELFPLLMLLVLLAFVAEGWLANRFYNPRKLNPTDAPAR